MSSLACAQNLPTVQSEDSSLKPAVTPKEAMADPVDEAKVTMPAKSAGSSQDSSIEANEAGNMAPAEEAVKTYYPAWDHHR